MEFFEKMLKTFEGQWKKLMKIKPSSRHYKWGQTLGRRRDGDRKRTKNWESGVPFSLHQFRPAVGSIGKITSVSLQPWMVTQLLEIGSVKDEITKGFNIIGEPGKIPGWFKRKIYAFYFSSHSEMV